jgi:hypothetical protein
MAVLLGLGLSSLAAVRYVVRLRLFRASLSAPQQRLSILEFSI